MKLWTIYCHTHIESGRRYIGLTSQTMERRWASHVKKACSSKGGRWHFPNAIRKYGKEAFSHEILWVFYDLESANDGERWLIEFFDTRNPEKGFNLAPGGAHGEWSDIRTTREKLSSIRVWQIVTQGTREKLRESALRNGEKIANSNRARGRDYFVQINRIGQQKRVRKAQSSHKNCHVHGILTLDECYLFTMESGYVKRFCKKCSIRKRSERKRRSASRLADTFL